MDKRVKSSIEKIKMPEDMKERIISNCEAAIDKKAESGKYTDHVYGIEHVKKHSVLRVVSGAAACAVLAGGIGLSAHLMKKQPSPSSLSASPEEITEDPSEITSEPNTETNTVPDTPTESDELIEEFMASDMLYLTVPDYDCLNEKGEPEGERSGPLGQEYTEAAKEIVKKHKFTEIAEDEFISSNDWDYLALGTRSPGGDFYYESSSFVFNRDGYACLSFISYNSEKLKNYEYEVERNDIKYYRFDDAEGLRADLLLIDGRLNEWAAFGTFYNFDYSTFDFTREADIAYTGEYPTEIDMADISDYSLDNRSCVIPVHHGDRAITEDERRELAELFDHAEYKRPDNSEFPTSVPYESIYFVYIDNKCKVTITVNDNNTLEYKYIPFTWDDTNAPAKASSAQYTDYKYVIDYQTFRDKIVEVLGEGVIYKYDISSVIEPFGKLSQNNINEFIAENTDYGVAISDEVTSDIDLYFSFLVWEESNSPEDEMMDDATKYVTLYNSIYDGNMGCVYTIYSNNFLSFKNESGKEIWYRCVTENEDIYTVVNKIISEHKDEQTNN